MQYGQIQAHYIWNNIDGLTVIAPDDVSRLLERMPIKKLCGIDKKMQRHLNMMSI
jgi:DNA polymerase-4